MNIQDAAEQTKRRIFSFSAEGKDRIVDQADSLGGSLGKHDAP